MYLNVMIKIISILLDHCANTCLALFLACAKLVGDAPHSNTIQIRKRLIMDRYIKHLMYNANSIRNYNKNNSDGCIFILNCSI